MGGRVEKIDGTALSQFTLGIDGDAALALQGGELGYINPGESFVPFSFATGFSEDDILTDRDTGLVLVDSNTGNVLVDR